MHQHSISQASACVEASSYMMSRRAWRPARTRNAWARSVNHAAGVGRGGLAVKSRAAAVHRASLERRFRTDGSPSARSRMRLAAHARNGASRGAPSRPKDLQRMVSDITVEPLASGDERNPAYEGPHFLLRVRIEGGITPASPPAAYLAPRRESDVSTRARPFRCRASE